MNIDVKFAEASPVNMAVDFSESSENLTAGFGEIQPLRGPKGDKGDPGVPGKDGYTPVKNKDYFTEADKAEMVASVIAALPKYDGEVVSV